MSVRQTLCCSSVCALVKCTSLLFFGSKLMPLVAAYVVYVHYVLSSYRHMLVSDLLNAIRLELSANPTTSSC